MCNFCACNNKILQYMNFSQEIANFAGGKVGGCDSRKKKEMIIILDNHLYTLILYGILSGVFHGRRGEGQ